MNIYFVCTGNTCRSPMAEAILKAMNIPNVDVRSAGIYALEGGGISENAGLVLQSENIQFQHQSKLVNEADLEWANLVLTMTEAHKKMLVQAFPQYESKFYTLKEYTTPYTSRDISDPFGGDYQQYKQTYNELKQHIERLVQLLKENKKDSGGLSNGTENEV